MVWFKQHNAISGRLPLPSPCAHSICEFCRLHWKELKKLHIYRPYQKKTERVYLFLWSVLLYLNSKTDEEGEEKMFAAVESASESSLSHLFDTLKEHDMNVPSMTISDDCTKLTFFMNRLYQSYCWLKTIENVAMYLPARMLEGSGRRCYSVRKPSIY